jgi:hypothetical protein
MQIFEWFCCFKGGHAFLENDGSCGWLSLSLNDDVIAKVMMVRAD